MLAEERFSLIMEQLNRKRTVTVQELCEALNTSESTIRRDLTELDRLGKLNKVHGGATLPDSRFLADEPTMEAKESQAVEQKRSIAQAAAKLINADDFVFIDAGSTTLELVRALAGDALKASYVTNGVAHARALARKGCRVYLPGGLLRPDRSHCGCTHSHQPAALQFYQGVHGCQRCGAGCRFYHAGPRGSCRESSGSAPCTGSLVPCG